MSNSKRKHLDMDARKVIEDGIRDNLSAREIARRIDVSQTTVTREIKANRTVKIPNRKAISARMRCSHFYECQYFRTLCQTCKAPSKTKSCRRCKVVKCFDFCPDFELRMCGKTESWPYICTCYAYDRDGCVLPKCRYSATEAHQLALSRRSIPRKGISVTQDELERITNTIKPLIKKGQSLEAIWTTHEDEFPIGVRTFYNYIEAGVVDIASLELPRKVRYKRRKKKVEHVRDRIDRAGRLYEDFLALEEEQRFSAVQIDTVLGFQSNRKRILSLQFKRLIFQLYLLLQGPEASNVVAAIDAIEISIGSRDAFEQVFGIMLADRGEEFDDFLGIERSVLEPGKKRCSLYYCDSMSPYQKPNCERNHEELRRILPKGRSDFDKLSAWDVAVVCSHVNSYPRPALGGLSPYTLASQVFPAGLLDSFGVELVQPDEVTLKPSLIAHAVKQ